MSASPASHGQVVVGTLGGVGAGLAMSALGASAVDASSFGLAFAAAAVKVLSASRRSSVARDGEPSAEEERSAAEAPDRPDGNSAGRPGH
ncbi:hypothetical protein ACWD3Z_15750 [Streptomyces sp. NPDC002740]